MKSTLLALALAGSSAAPIDGGADGGNAATIESCPDWPCSVHGQICTQGSGWTCCAAANPPHCAGDLCWFDSSDLHPGDVCSVQSPVPTSRGTTFAVDPYHYLYTYSYEEGRDARAGGGCKNKWDETTKCQRLQSTKV